MGRAFISYVTAVFIYITSGQRCTCSRRLFIENSANGDAILEKLIAATKHIKVADSFRHQSGHAIDFVAYDENNKVTWDFKYYAAISRAFKQAARELNVAIVWGGDWKSLKDGPHIELSRRVYT